MNFDLAFYWKLFVRRLPVMAAFVIAGSTVGVITALKTPATWSTSARLLVEEPQIPDEMVRSTVQTDAAEQLDIIQEKLLTRANLIDIANELSVFTDIRTMEPDTVEEKMREATNVQRRAGRNRATVLTISFEGRSGPIAANVVNEYVTIVLEENTNFRITRAESTLRFFEQEVQRMERDLADQSNAISAFKAENVDALPENQSYRLSRQTLLQERLERLEREKSLLLAQREDLKEIFERTGEVGTSATDTAPSQNAQRLTAAQNELNQALSLYSETHPNIIRLTALIERLEEAVAAEAVEAGLGTEDTSLEQAQLNAALAEVDNRIEFIQIDIDATLRELDTLNDAISQSSSNGIALNALEREYAVIESRYNVAVQNLNAARMSERIESTAQGRRITVIENATIPTVPTGPNRPFIAIAGAIAGIGLAGLYFMLLEVLNRTIRRPAELANRFSVIPIATVPYMESRRRRLLRRSGIIVATLIVLVTVPSALWYIDVNFIPLEILVQRGLSRLGIG